MKRIILSGVQVHNLVNMLHGVFPPESAATPYFNKGMVMLPLKELGNSYLTIHWYELCFTLLADRITEVIWGEGMSKKRPLQLHMISSEDNPVDYLYKLYIKYESSFLPVREQRVDDI